MLDVGCAKGFLMHDLKNEIPNINVYGLDISKYAKENAMNTIKDYITLGSCDQLPYNDDFFDLSISINTIHNLDYNGCKKSIMELKRVTKNDKNIFIQVDAYNNEKEKEIFEDWLLTAKTYLKPKEWLQMFNDVGYNGTYFWTIIGFTD